MHVGCMPCRRLYLQEGVVGYDKGVNVVRGSQLSNVLQSLTQPSCLHTKTPLQTCWAAYHHRQKQLSLDPNDVKHLQGAAGREARYPVGADVVLEGGDDFVLVPLHSLQQSLVDGLDVGQHRRKEPCHRLF